MNGQKYPRVNVKVNEAKWQIFISRCLAQRIPASRFAKLAVQLNKRRSLTSKLLCTCVKSSQEAHEDPLLPLYITILLQNELVQSSRMLRVLIDLKEKSIERTRKDETDREIAMDHQRSNDLENLVLGILTTHAIHGTARLSQSELKYLLETTIKYLRLMIDHSSISSGNETENGLKRNVRPESAYNCEQFASLLLCYLNKDEFAQMIEGSLAEEELRSFAKSLTSFINLLTERSPQFVSRFDLVLRSLPILSSTMRAQNETLEESNVDLGHLQISDIVHTDLINSRASLLILLDTNFSGLPFLDDSHILNYLQMRYKGDVQSSILDLVTATFDVLAVSVRRGDNADKTFMPRSFLVNKVPLIMSTLSSMNFMPLEHETLISQALSRLDPTVFPTFPHEQESSTSDKNRTTLSDARREFLFACSLHDLIAQSSIERLIGENSIQGVASEQRKSREAFVNDYNKNPQSLETLVNGMKSMDGNASSMVEAVVDIFKKHCGAQETMSLRGLCRKVSQDPQFIDAIAVHVGLMTILQPLCLLLNDWKHEEHQGEHQPIYDEFSACMLFLLASMHRFDLCVDDIVCNTGSNVLHRLLDQGAAESKSLKSLSTDQNRQLGDWIKNLFEIEGVSDELMSTCPPQDFYILTPTIMHQIVLACRSKMLDVDAQKNGLELLLEPYLIPSLVPALFWFSTYLWKNQRDVDTSLPLLQKLVQPASLQRESSSMHSTILSIVGRSIYMQLEELQSTQKVKKHEKEIVKLLDLLRPHIDYDRTTPATLTELKKWCASQPTNNSQTNIAASGFLNCARNVVGPLCYWSSTCASPEAVLLPPLPTSSYRQIRSAICGRGAMQTLKILVEDGKLASESGLGNYVLDLLVALVYADYLHSTHGGRAVPNANSTAEIEIRAPKQHRQNLLDALRVVNEDAADLARKDPIKTEIIVRVLRKVEELVASLANASTIPMNGVAASVPMSLDVNNTEDMMQGLDMGNAGMVDLGDTMAQQDQQNNLSENTHGPQLDDGLNLDSTALQLDIDSALANATTNMQQPLDAQQNHNNEGMKNDEFMTGTGENDGLPSATGSIDDIFADLPNIDFD